MDGIGNVGSRLREIAERIADIQERVTTPPNPFGEAGSATPDSAADGSASTGASSSLQSERTEFDALLREATALSNASLSNTTLLSPTSEAAAALGGTDAAATSISDERLALLRRLLEITAPTTSSDSGSASATAER